MKKHKRGSRRQFLKTTLVAAGGFVLAGCGRQKETPFPATVPAATAAPTPVDELIYLDPERTVEERVEDLVGRMTLEEKVSQLGTEADAVDRLGIPAYDWWSEAGHGVARAGIATVFPQVIGLAATWNADLIRTVAGVISDEGRAKHHEAVRNGIRGLYAGLTFFCPNINIFRDPRWGRGQETYGEDPYLTGQLAVNFIRGMQGDDPRYLKTVATAKHYAVHSGPEEKRHYFNAVVSERDLRMTYLPAFRAAVVEGKVGSVMGAYNRVNGEACCASPTLLQKILREEWGFEGYVVADCGAVDDIYQNHMLVKSPAEAAALAVKAGCDLECGCTYGIACDYGLLTQAVQDGLLTEEDIDRSVKRLLAARFRLGMFDPEDLVAYARIPYSVVDSEEHRALALEAARQSLVLLKNQGGLLPLDPSALKSVAVIGPNADETLVLSGNYFGTAAAPVSVLEGIRTAVNPDCEVRYARGSAIIGNNEDGFDEAVQAARDSQAVVMVMGLSQEMEGEEGQTEGNQPGVRSLGDRISINLPDIQERLLRAVRETGKPVILVLLNGSALAINWANDNVPAILEAWYPGQAGGTAVAEAIFGRANPGGRLPVTFYASTSDLPKFDEYSMENRTYRYFTGKPLYPFGYGLSYTTFAYRNLRIHPEEVNPGDSVTVEAEVENTGKREGDEVVQLYLKDAEASLSVPRLQLQGFARLRLAPGEKQTVKFTLKGEQTAFADENGGWVIEPGEFRVWVGGQQPDLEAPAQPANVLEGKFSVRG
ncbi:MAG: glycoside hydrolase family 3 C-terminal domain-containing protein [Anaerolineales bacterium]|nr:glycoside hydrolase family 3 C-terminal domain-containing protein [Anaerolineales bacterium]